MPKTPKKKPANTSANHTNLYTAPGSVTGRLLDQAAALMPTVQVGERGWRTQAINRALEFYIEQNAPIQPVFTPGQRYATVIALRTVLDNLDPTTSQRHTLEAVIEKLNSLEPTLGK